MKTILKIILLMLIAIYFSGCASAHLVKEIYSPEKGGTVKYKNSAFSGASSKERAYVIMSNYCAPLDYSIIQAASQSEAVSFNANSSYYGGVNITPNKRNYIYLDFKCEKGS